MNSLTANFRLSPYRILFKYYLFILVASAALRFIIYLLAEWQLMEPLKKIDFMFAEIWGYWWPVAIILIGPITEELVWRLPLIYSNRNLSFSASLFAFIILMQFLSYELVNKWIFLGVSMVICAALFQILTTLIRKDEKKSLRLKIFWMNNSKAVLVFSIITFALAHLSNYEGITEGQVMFSPLIIAPELVAGYYLSKIRLSHGLIWSLQLHMFMNTLAFLAMLWQKRIG